MWEDKKGSMETLRSHGQDSGTSLASYENWEGDTDNQCFKQNLLVNPWKAENLIHRHFKPQTKTFL